MTNDFTSNGYSDTKKGAFDSGISSQMSINDKISSQYQELTK